MHKEKNTKTHATNDIHIGNYVLFEVTNFEKGTLGENRKNKEKRQSKQIYKEVKEPVMSREECKSVDMSLGF